jgi:hypothetical protein
MSPSSDPDRIAAVRRYFVLADQGRPEVLDLFHEDAELYFPTFGFASGRQSLFDIVKGFEGALEFIQHDYDTMNIIPAGGYERRQADRAAGRGASTPSAVALDATARAQHVPGLGPALSTTHFTKRVYSVPSRLIGCEVKVRQHPDVIEVWYRGKRTETMPRLRGEQYHRIDYRHVIWSLVRTPGAFARYRYRDAGLPQSLRRAS